MNQNKYIKVIDTNEKNLETHVKALNDDFNIKLVLGFISPHINFDSMSKKIKSLFPSDTKVVLTTTAGELCTFNLEQKRDYLYNDASST